MARVPLGDFRDYRAVARPASRERPLHVRVQEHSLKPIRVWYDQPPAAWSRPRPNVWRRQAGYSRREIEEAGISMERAAKWSIPLDLSREGAEPGNANRIRGWIDAQRG